MNSEIEEFLKTTRTFKSQLEILAKLELHEDEKEVTKIALDDIKLVLLDNLGENI
jgi:hypothetical protein